MKKISYIENSEVTVDQLNAFTDYVTQNQSTPLITGPDMGINARLLAVNVAGEPVIMLNPVIVNSSEQRVSYVETNLKGKPKRTVRYVSITVMTDNMHEVEFSAEKNTDFNNVSMFADKALYECVLVQRGIDMLNGIDVDHPAVRYTTEVRLPAKEGRNQRTMLKGPSGEFMYVKNKKLKSYTESGWQLV